MIETEREFSRVCMRRGFARTAPRFYARCIGDGIYQTIYTGFRKYIYTDSPKYSAEKTKSYYVSIGLRSMYSCYDEHAFVPGKDSGGYSPADLCEKRKHASPFHGIEEDYTRMEQGAFDVLDAIDTQEKLVEWWDAVQTIDTGRRIHDIHLVEPLLLCGNQHDAECEISVSIAQGMDAYASYLDRVECGCYNKDTSYEQRFWNSARKQLDLWRWCIGRDQNKLREYLSENYKRNLLWAHKYEIPTVSLTPPRSV